MPYPYDYQHNTFLTVVPKLSIANGATNTVLQVITPALATELTTRIFLQHVLVIGSGTTRGQINLREDPTSTTGSTAPSMIANTDRRTSPPAPQTLLYTDGGAVTGGTLINRQYIYPNVAERSAIFRISDTEIILKPATKYTMTFTNNTGATANCFLTVGFREQPNTENE